MVGILNKLNYFTHFLEDEQVLEQEEGEEEEEEEEEEKGVFEYRLLTAPTISAFRSRASSSSCRSR